MTPLLDQAVAEVRKLPDADQEAIAAMILEELTDEERWEASFARSHAKLLEMAARARQQIKNGEFVEKGFDEL